ncbi:hypothetical protein Pint_03241 [Pistacia integerrima]|uniref:Uncharacterized protein n=1 Tax=Pistacia integerrima TaxID=434235 RepID=A0ACC0ZNA2_9ROSI|nr:hypothetical protein Pint_03241 [Pistacia integerrima]
MANHLTALMNAVQVMNFLKTLILRTLQERGDSVVEKSPISHLEPFDENGHQSPSESCVQVAERDGEEIEQAFMAEESAMESSTDFGQKNETIDGEDHGLVTYVEKSTANNEQSHQTPAQVDTLTCEIGACEFNG